MKRHSWAMWDELSSYCRRCGVFRYRWELPKPGREYLWRDGQWRRKCPSCDPVEKDDDNDGG